MKVLSLSSLLLVVLTSALMAIKYTDDAPFLSPNVDDVRLIIKPIVDRRPVIKPIATTEIKVSTIQLKTSSIKKEEKLKTTVTKKVEEQTATFVAKESLVKEEKKTHETIKVEDEATNFFNSLNKEKNKPVNMEN